jgi:hypothetical protein
MTIYALVTPTDTVDRRASNVRPNVGTKPGWRWLEVEQVNPSYDPVTEIKTGPVTTIEETSVVDTWTVRLKTAQEIDDEKAAKVSAIDALQFLVSFDMENRVRVLESKSTITAAQYRAALKARL